MIIYRIAKESVDGIYLSSVPCYFDGVADGSFYTAGGSVAFFGDGRI
jgi:hypothetical protein